MKNPLQVLLAALTAALFSFLSLPATAQLVEGRHYVRVQTPQPTEVAGKVEVIEFFWYGCPACNQFDPLIRAWANKLPPDVHVRKVPAIFRDTWAPGARLFYALEAMNLGRLHPAVFRAWHVERVDLNNENSLFAWVARQGVDRQKFIETYRSFAVDAQVRRAAEMSTKYGIGGVPAVVVGGKYLPAPRLGSWEEKLRVVDGLIQMNRTELRRGR